MTKTKHHSEYDLHKDYMNIRSALADTTHDMKGRANEMFRHSMRNVKDKSADIKDNVEEYVNKKPFHAIGIALATGFLLGYLFRK